MRKWSRNSASSRPGSLRSRAVTGAAWVLLAMAICLSGCSKIKLAPEIPFLFGGRSHMTVEVLSKLNQNSPLAFDLLVVYDKKLLESLEKKDAKTWFENRKQFLADKSHKKTVEVHHWEWVPGQSTVKFEFHFKRNAYGGLAFANYLSVGEHRAQFNPHEHLTVVLDEKDFTLVQ